ncbi:PRC-barrel domain-containing protein [soil metagenome]
MLRNLKDLHGYSIRATDGDIGKVKDFYFDDERFTVRYLVVETGGWRSSRKVLISPFSIGEHNHIDKVLPVSITKEQVKNSPDIDTDKPVSRQHEADYLAYYGYPDYWGGVGLWGSEALPGTMTGVGYLGVPPSPELDKSIADARALRHANDDPHLRSCKEVTGYHIKASDGEIGHIQGFIVDEQSWAIRYLVADTSNWWMGHQVIVSPSWIQDVSWAERNVTVHMTQKAIQDAPPYDPVVLIDRAQEIGIYEHYGRPGYW